MRTYFAYYLQARGADSKEALTELMVADRIKASLSAEGLEYVRLREGESWLKPTEVAKLLQTFEQAKGKGRASKPGTPHADSFPPKRVNADRGVPRCHLCRGQGHIAKNCPTPGAGKGGPQPIVLPDN